jgi:hypothetical protein
MPPARPKRPAEIPSGFSSEFGARIVKGAALRYETKMTEEISPIDAIVALMRDNWDLPADCNDGELYSYAEHVVDRIRASDDAASLVSYLQATQTGKLDMPDSPAYRVIAESAVRLIGSTK